jgi:CheY-like chemotaxis protein
MSSRRTRSRGRVLVVDDDPDWVESIADFLREEGYSVLVADNGLAAMETLTRTHPLAVVTDLAMPGMDGRQLLVGVHEQDGHVPVIVVSAERITGHDPSLEGAFRIMRKPVAAEDLLTALSDASAHRVDHLPLHKLWDAAGAARLTRPAAGAKRGLR